MHETSGFAAHYGHWGLVVMVIVVTSWLFYRFAAPSGWREWTGAGLVQAFVIALYAEMYGFPLTIYLLSGFFGIDIPLTVWTGHLWATLLGYGAMGAIIEMAIGTVFLAIGGVLLILGWKAAYAAHRQNRMADSGVYGLMRHPQYTGIMLAVFGQIVHWPTVVTLVLFPVIVFAYVRLARKEELDMIRRFDGPYKAYMQRVPRFFPGREQWKQLLGVSG